MRSSSFESSLVQDMKSESNLMMYLAYGGFGTGQLWENYLRNVLKFTRSASSLQGSHPQLIDVFYNIIMACSARSIGSDVFWSEIFTFWSQIHDLNSSKSAQSALSSLTNEITVLNQIWCLQLDEMESIQSLYMERLNDVLKSLNRYERNEENTKFEDQKLREITNILKAMDFREDEKNIVTRLIQKFENA